MIRKTTIVNGNEVRSEWFFQRYSLISIHEVSLPILKLLLKNISNENSTCAVHPKESSLPIA